MLMIEVGHKLRLRPCKGIIKNGVWNRFMYYHYWPVDALALVNYYLFADLRVREEGDVE